MRKYEGVFILNTSIDEEKRNAIMDRFKGIIEANGSIINVDEWGNRKLAYEINDLTDGYYVIMTFEAETEAIDEVNRIAKITEPVIRHMIVKEEE